MLRGRDARRKIRGWRAGCVVILICGLQAGALGVVASAEPWALPAEGACQTGEASLFPFRPGDVFDRDRLEVLHDYLPTELWSQNQQFFQQGMRFEIGPCFRNYSPPAFFREATEEFRGRARVLEDGGIERCVAGLPFPPDSISVDDPQAGEKWAWNVLHRYRGAGFRGDFRHTVLLGKQHRSQSFEGSLFKIQVSHRADLPDEGYRIRMNGTTDWIAGGRLLTPQGSRAFTWRQYRARSHERSLRRSDDLHAYLPSLRRSRRLSAHHVQGVYMPVGSLAERSLSWLGAGVLAADSGSGESGLLGDAEMRPLVYDYRVLGLKNVLAPINVANPMYPEQPDRDFGTSGLSFASDRWDLRRAIVLEGTRKRPLGGPAGARIVLYVDLQTLHPLYFYSYDSADKPLEMVVYAGRWSEDRADYPRWPADPQLPVQVIDLVGVAAVNLGRTDSRRHEAWGVVSVPPDDRTLEKLISVAELSKGR